MQPHCGDTSVQGDSAQAPPAPTVDDESLEDEPLDALLPVDDALDDVAPPADDALDDVAPPADDALDEADELDAIALDDDDVVEPVVLLDCDAPPAPVEPCALLAVEVGPEPMAPFPSWSPPAPPLSSTAGLFAQLAHASSTPPMTSQPCRMTNARPS
jgi:hypothetical protein